MNTLNTLLKDRRALFLVIGIALCSTLTAIPIIRSMIEAANYVPPTPLSEVVLQLEDLNSQVFEQSPPTTDCNKYLSLQSAPDNINLNEIDCYQVKFKSRDDAFTILNAIWVFNNLAVAESEINSLIELIPPTGNIDMQVVSLPRPFGNKNGASLAVITGGRNPLYVSNLYWRREATVIRLTIMSYQSPISATDLMIPAQSIEARLENR